MLDSLDFKLAKSAATRVGVLCKSSDLINRVTFLTQNSIRQRNGGRAGRWERGGAGVGGGRCGWGGGEYFTEGLTVIAAHVLKSLTIDRV